LLVCFFFQAEDGIRDYKVTGVQTCALPISGARPQDGRSAIRELANVIHALEALNDLERGITVNVGVVRGGTRPNVIAEEAYAERSEERRVGKECRGRWGRYHEKEKEWRYEE